jgi:hypothetical protein
MSKPRVPANLQARGKNLWSDVVGTYQLRPDELLVLEDACREADLVARIEKELRGAPLMVKGSMGQQVASPLVQELRQHRAVFARLMKQLDLPDPGDAEGAGSDSRSSQAREAAAARWRRGA